ncbi:MAG: hypothetical protein O2985_13320 [Proteobacteria bacterium]|nr:hypothetical protein [Pseudomonadota bacterium]
MTLLDEIQTKLEDAHNQVQEVTAELRTFADLKRSLQATDEGVRAAAEGLESLSKSLKNGSDAIDRVATTLCLTSTPMGQNRRFS